MVCLAPNRRNAKTNFFAVKNGSNFPFARPIVDTVSPNPISNSKDHGIERFYSITQNFITTLICFDPNVELTFFLFSRVVMTLSLGPSLHSPYKFQFGTGVFHLFCALFRIEKLVFTFLSFCLRRAIFLTSTWKKIKLQSIRHPLAQLLVRLVKIERIINTCEVSPSVCPVTKHCIFGFGSVSLLVTHILRKFFLSMMLSNYRYPALNPLRV